MKIESKDLRIGNWVNHKSDICKVWSLSQEWLRVENEYSKAVSYDHIFGIPITPEILEKAGFGNTITTREGQYVQYGLKSGSWDFMFEFYNNGEPGFYLDMVGIDVFYLHQLQNLYFSLVGQELNIKL